MKISSFIIATVYYFNGELCTKPRILSLTEADHYSKQGWEFALSFFDKKELNTLSLFKKKLIALFVKSNMSKALLSVFW